MAGVRAHIRTESCSISVYNKEPDSQILCLGKGNVIPVLN
jgi:hypothetical protein